MHTQHTHELVMMGITAFVCLPMGYIFGTIVQRLRDIHEFDQRDEFISEAKAHPRLADRRAA
ncbi:MAG TPA: hypothetical protein VJA94_00455 [Candidatus Angelobacter sp.]